MLKKKLLVSLLIMGLIVGLTGMAMAADYPTKNIEFVIPFGVGGGCDVSGRTLAKAAEEYFNQPVVPTNKPGAGGAVTYKYVKNSDPDGYTVAWNSTSIVTSTNLGNAPFDYTALENVCRTQVTDMPLAVRADAPWDTLKEFINYAQDNPVKIGNAGQGSATHLLTIAIKQAADIEVINVPLGASRRIPSLIGGEIDAIIVPLPGIEPQVKAGKAKILGFPSPKSPEGYEDVSTFQEAGYDVSIQLFRGISVPKGTPQEIVDEIEAAFKKAAASESYKSLAEKRGFEVDFMGQEKFKEYLKSQNEIIADAMKAVGIHKSQK